MPEAALLALLAVGALACSDQAADSDRGPIDDTLAPDDRVAWPGVDHAAGRVIPFLRGFGEGRPIAYWFLGFGSRQTADSFWFCREGDDTCPLDEHRRLNWDSLVGHPLFSRIPGQAGFSPFWQMWVVRVPPSFVPDSVKTMGTLDRLAQAGVVTADRFILDFGRLYGESIGPSEVLLHCALVLAGTELEDNGGMMPDGRGPMRTMERRMGWFEGYQVAFVDFSASDGVFSAADDSDTRPLMRTANIYVFWRTCLADPRPAICDLPGYASAERRPVSERGLGQDITGDGDIGDTNNVVGARPCSLARPTEKPYSPLWAPQALTIKEPWNPGLIDSYRDQTRSDIASADVMFDEIARSHLTEPKLMLVDETGKPVPGNEGQVLFNCPEPVPSAYVPYPCEENP